MSSSDVVAEEYASSLSDLVANSKPLINMLTMLAEENIDHAPAIVQAVERHLQQVGSDIKLPVLYLIDSIVKNVRQAYIGLFTQNIVSTFCSVFEKVDEKTRAQMFKLRQTWNDVFPPKKLYAMDVRVSSIDPAWPITAPAPTTSIHINPKFFPKQGNPQAPMVSPLQSGPGSAPLVAAAAAAAAAAVVNAAEDPQAITEAKMREQLLKKQKKLLELQQKKLELELLQTKAKLEEQQKQLERQTDHLHVQQRMLPALQSVSQEASRIFGTSLFEMASSLGVKAEHATSLGVKADHATQPVISPVQVPPQVAVTAPERPAVTSSTGPSRSPGKTKTEKAKAAGKQAAGPGGNSSRSRDPRLATRQSVSAQPNVISNVTSENLQQPDSQLASIQDNTSSVFETVKLETAKPKPQITINIANKGNANKEPQGVSKKDPRLNSNKVHVSNSKVRSSESKNSGSSKGPNKSTRGPSPLPAPQSPSRCSKPAPLPRKAHGKGSSSSTKASHKVIDLTDSPPHKTTDKKVEELAGKDKDSHSESLSKSSSSSSSSGSISSSSPGSKKDSHKSKLSNTTSRQSSSEKKKGSEKGGKASEVGSGSNLSSRRAKSPGGGCRRSRERERDRSVSKKFDMFEPEADSPSPPPPPVISDNKKREDTAFKDVKVSKKGRNYVRRNRRDESRSPEVSGVSSGDVDLRLGAPPEKHPRMGAFPTDAATSSTEDDAKKTLVDATTKDVDLRQLSRSPTKKRPSMERSDQPPNKKSKAEMIDVLFGNEDVDLRQLPPISVVTQPGMPPSPPPPPIISQPSPTQSITNQENNVSNSPTANTDIDKDTPSETTSETLLEDCHLVKENGEGKNFHGWEKYKESKPDIYKSPFRSHKLDTSYKGVSPARDTVYNNSRDRGVGHFNRHIGERMEIDGLGRPLLYHRFHDNMALDRRHRHGQDPMSSPIGEDTDMRTHLPDPDTLEDLDMNISIIIQQAAEQVKNGSISPAQYRTLLNQVIHLNELQKLREAKRRDQQENKELWERNRHRVTELGKASPRNEDENSRDSLSGGRYGDIDERFPVLKPRVQQPSSVPSPPEPHWNDVAPPHHGRPGVWEQHPPPWARGMGPAGSMGPIPGPQFPRMMHGGPFHRPPGPGQDFPPGPSGFGAMPRWRPGQFNRPPFDGEMDGRPGFRFEQYNMRFPRGAGPLPPPPLAPQQQPQQQPHQHHQQPPPPPPPPPLPQQQQQQQQQPLVSVAPLMPPTPQELANGELPLADSLLLEAIAQDSMRTINIDGVPREIRFYGDTAVVMLAWDDPREIGFQGGTRCITFDDRENVLCSFNGPYREFVLDGSTHSIRLGAPTRELYVDGKWHECFFGGPPVSVDIGGKMRLIKLEGPPPQVKIALTKRTDLVAGKINLIINARNMVPIFLDAKPQRFDIEGKPHILRFTHALTNVQINNRPFKVEFGGLPKPIVVKGKKHFIRFSVLPRGIQPGYINIINMEGDRLPSPVHAEDVESATFSPPDENNEVNLRKVNEPALPMLGRSRQKRFGVGQESPNESETARSSPSVHTDGVVPKLNQPVTSQLPLEMLTSLMPVAMAPSSGYSYQVEQESQDTQQKPTTETAIPVASVPLATAAAAAATTAGAAAVIKTAPDATVSIQTVVAPNTATGVTAAGIPFLLPEINVDELFQKLVATGIVTTPSSTAEEVKKKKDDDTDTVKHVDFSQPETLKVRQPALIAALYSGIQCSSCGVRFAPEQTMKYSQHLDWHFRQNRRDRDNTRKAQSRKWYYDISDWIQFEEIEDLEERAQSWFETQQAAEGRAEEKEPVEIPSVPAGENAEDCVCDVCHDKFEQFYNEETEEWHLRLAIRVEDKTYHPLCYEDLKVNLERSLDESVTTDEAKQESDKDGEKTDEATGDDAVAEESKETEEKDIKQEVDSAVPADSTADEPEGPSDKVKQEQVENAEVVSHEEKSEDPSEELKEEPMQVAECDSTVAKTEKADVDAPMEEESAVTAVPKVDTTHTEVACSIDGNVKFEDKLQAPIAGPLSGKIKINITKPLAAAPAREAQSEGDAESSAAEGDADDADEALPAPPPTEGLMAEIKDLAKEPTLEQEFPEPPPPGIEPVRLKPRLVGRKLTELPPVMKGTELSGLCSIM